MKVDLSSYTYPVTKVEDKMIVYLKDISVVIAYANAHHAEFIYLSVEEDNAPPLCAYFVPPFHHYWDQHDGCCPWCTTMGIATEMSLEGYKIDQ